MAWFSRRRVKVRAAPAPCSGSTGSTCLLRPRPCAAGRAPSALERGVLAVVGRNGMGKTTLCNAITGLVPASRQHQARRRRTGRPARRNAIAQARHRLRAAGPPRLAVAHGRRDICGWSERGAHRGAWTIERVYDDSSRGWPSGSGNGGSQLSGGEQQMLAIGRALLFNPRLLVMDEPTEGLAPGHRRAGRRRRCARLGDEARISVLLIEQNLGVAIDVAERGRGDGQRPHRAATMPAPELAADRDLQQRLLGVTLRRRRRGSRQQPAGDGAGEPTRRRLPRCAAAPTTTAPPHLADLPPARAVRGFTRWNAAGTARRWRDQSSAPAEPCRADHRRARLPRRPPRVRSPVAASCGRAAYVAGTFDTKGRELALPAQLPGEARPAHGHGRSLDLGRAVACLRAAARRWRAIIPRASRAVFTGDRGPRVTAMADRLRALHRDAARSRRHHLGRRLRRHVAGDAGDARAAHRRSEDDGLDRRLGRREAPTSGRRDICMMYSVTDVSGHQPHLRAGAVERRARAGRHDRPRRAARLARPSRPSASPCSASPRPACRACTKQLEDRYDCLVFHATGIGGQSMEKLADSGLLAGVIDATTTEIADEVGGGVLSAGPARLDAIIAQPHRPMSARAARSTWSTSGPMDTVPERFSRPQALRPQSARSP